MLRTRVLARLAAGLVAAAGLAGAAGTTPAAATHAARNPIDHVLVLMQENRSFDSYFGRLHFEGQPRTAAEPLGARNPDPTNPGGPPIRAFHQTAYCAVAALNHPWTGTHNELDGHPLAGLTAANVPP